MFVFHMRKLFFLQYTYIHCDSTDIYFLIHLIKYLFVGTMLANTFNDLCQAHVTTYLLSDFFVMAICNPPDMTIV